MTDQIFVTTYRVNRTSPGFALAADHFKKVDRAHNLHGDIMKEFGAVAFRQGHDGRLISLFFPADQIPPTGFRQTADKRSSNGIMVQEAVPSKSTKVGKELFKRFEETEHRPADLDLCKQFGWTLEGQYYSNRRFYPTVQRLDLPQLNFFLRLPRSVDDKWKLHDDLIPMPEADYMWFLQEHNSAVQKQKIGKAA